MAAGPASSRARPLPQGSPPPSALCSTWTAREEAGTDTTNSTDNRFITIKGHRAVISTPTAHLSAVFSRHVSYHPVINAGQMPLQMGTFTPTETSTPLQPASVGDWFHQHFRARRGSAHGLIAAFGLHLAATREHTNRRQDWPAKKKCARRQHKESACG